MKNDAIEAVDLSAFLTTEESVLEIMSPGGTATGWKITLASPAHPQVIAFNEKQMRQTLHRQKLIEQAQVNGKKYVAEERSPDEQRRENIASFVARIIDWTPIRLPSGTVTFSPKNAEDLLIRPEMNWALTQIIEAIGDEKRFTKRSETA